MTVFAILTLAVAVVYGVRTSSYPGTHTRVVGSSVDSQTASMTDDDLTAPMSLSDMSVESMDPSPYPIRLECLFLTDLLGHDDTQETTVEEIDLALDSIESQLALEGKLSVANYNQLVICKDDLLRIRRTLVQTLME